MTAVAVVGSVNVDLFVRVDRLPSAGETVIGGEHWRAQGGKGANQAVAAARAGARVALVAAVGQDDLGAAARSDLEDESVDTRWVRTIAGAATGVALITVSRSGENTIAVASGANARLLAPDVERALHAIRPRVVLVNLEVPDEAVEAAALAAARLDALCILNPAPARPVGAGVLARTGVLTPNEHEARSLLGGAGAGVEPRWSALYERLGGPGPRFLVVTLGPRGALLVSGREEALVPARQVGAVDTTGAGDAFNGVLAASLAEGRDVRESVRRAVAAGTLATLRPGARAGPRSRQELEAFLHGAAPG